MLFLKMGAGTKCPIPCTCYDYATGIALIEVECLEQFLVTSSTELRIYSVRRGRTVQSYEHDVLSWPRNAQRGESRFHGAPRD